MQIYIHIPFCRSKCAYCDFNSFVLDDKGAIFAYLSALKREIALAGETYKEASVDTVYIGGGTPSILDASAICGIADTVRKHFKCDIKEFTVECNPESTDRDKLLSFKDAGIDRVSIGVQSLDDANLKSIGRVHDAKCALEKLEVAAGIMERVSADLIVGLPYDTEETVRRETEAVSDIVSHASVYCLTLEEGTPLYERERKGEVWLPSDDETEEYMETASDVLKSRGFCRYEISNFAKEGMESLHNLGYWRRREYLGFGAGAHSCVATSNGSARLQRGIRFASPKDIHAYIAGVNCAPDFNGIPRTDIEVLDENAVKYERIMLGLRTAEGIDAALLDGKDLSGLEKYFVFGGGRAALNEEGMAVMNVILSRIL